MYVSRDLIKIFGYIVSGLVFLIVKNNLTILLFYAYFFTTVRKSCLYVVDYGLNRAGKTFFLNNTPKRRRELERKIAKGLTESSSAIFVVVPLGLEPRTP